MTDKELPSDGGVLADIDQRVCEYVDRINLGESLDPVEILAENPIDGNEILQRLERFVDCFAVTTAPESLGTLGDYTLRRQIGRGGMGVVYEAWENSMDRAVALKVLPAGVAADDRAFQRFMQEARTAGKLSHPNVVPVHAMGQVEHSPYFAMELVEGETLAQVVARIRDAEPESDTPFGPKDEVAYFGTMAKAFADVADGLQHAHSKGVTHRDIKPSNLILDAEGRLRILDFGLARIEGQESLTLSGDFVGTPLYMSPEQARRKKIPVDHRTDVYSLGATMYEALCGRPPFRGKDHTDTLSQIIERDPVEPRKVNPRVPKDLETIVLKCLRKDSGDRYGTAEALAQDLSRFVRGDPIEARPQSAWENVARRAWRQRTRLAALACAVLLLFTSALVVHQRVRDQRETDEASYRRLVQDGASSLLISRMRLSPSAVGRGPVRGSHHDLLDARPGDHPVKRAVQRLRKAANLLPGRVEAHYYLAQANVLLGQEEEARRHLEHALARDRSFAPALLLHASLQAEDGDKASGRPTSVAARLQAAEQLPGWGSLYLKARRAVAEEDWPTAAKAYGALMLGQEVEGVPHAGLAMEASLGRGTALLEAGEYLEAAREFAVSGDRFGDSAEPTLFLAKTYYLLGFEAETDKVLQIHFDRSAYSERDRVALRIAALCQELGAYEIGLEWAGRIEDGYLRSRSRAILSLSRGFHGESALEAGMKAVLQRPDDPQLYLYLRSALFMVPREKVGSFEPQCQRLVRENPDHPDALVLLGNLECCRRNYRDGISHFKRALELDPENTEALVGLSHAHSHTEEEEKRAEVLQRILKRTPIGEGEGSDRPWYRRRVHRLRDEKRDWAFRLAQIAQDSILVVKRYDEGVKLCRRALELDPRCAYALHCLGTACSGLGDYAEAIRQYDEALSIYPFGVTYMNKANALRRLEHFEEALLVYEKALEATPDDPRHTENVVALLQEAKGGAKEAVLNRLLAMVRAMQVARDRPIGFTRITVALARAFASASLVEGHLEKSLQCARIAVEATGRSDSAALATLSRVRWLKGEKRKGMLLLEEAAALPDAPWFLAEALEEARGEVRPRLLSYNSADAALRSLDRVVLVPEGAEWHYFEGYQEPTPSAPLEWTNPSFDDRSWTTGYSPLEYEDGDDASVLRDMKNSYTSLYVRHRFRVDDRSAYRDFFLVVRVDDGFVAYLNGDEIARFQAPGDNWIPANATAPVYSDEPLRPYCVKLNPNQFEDGDNVLAIQGLNHKINSSDFALIPVLEGMRRPEREKDQHLLQQSEPAAQDDDDRRVLAYLEARIRERDGKHAQAAGILARLATDDERQPEPHLRYVESLRASEQPAMADRHLRRVLGLGIPPTRALWDLWVELGLRDLQHTPQDMLSAFPHGPQRTKDNSYGEDIRWLLERLAARETVRINCGGGAFQQKNGAAWGSDRFFFGGSTFGGGTFKGEISGPEENRVYRTERFFTHGTVKPASYRIPLPPGRYRVTLHFAEIWHHEPGRRRFHVDLEEDRAVPDYEPLQKGFAVAHAEERMVSVNDGSLDITFTHIVGAPKISGLEVERLK